MYLSFFIQLKNTSYKKYQNNFNNNNNNGIKLYKKERERDLISTKDDVMVKCIFHETHVMQVWVGWVLDDNM